MNKLPRVGMIWMPDNPVSVKYKEIVSHSWTNAGFELDYYDAITPENVQEKVNRPLNFGTKTSRKRFGQPFTPTEQAVWYSHAKMWDIAARKSSPLIIIEHDIILLKHIEKWTLEQHPILGLSHVGLLSKKAKKGYRISAGGAYMLTNEIAKKMLRNIPKLVDVNSDAYIHQFIARYGAFRHEYSTQLYLPDLGATIDHGAENPDA